MSHLFGGTPDPERAKKEDMNLNLFTAHSPSYFHPYLDSHRSMFSLQPLCEKGA